MKQQARFLLCFCVASVLTSCNAPFRPNFEPTRQAVLPQYQTVSAFLTATALVSATIAPVAEVRPVVNTIVSDAPQTNPLPQTQSTPAVTKTSVKSLPTTPVSSSTPSPKPKPQSADHLALPCDAAQPGRILDISVPDGTAFQPGVFFSKTWRLVNAGTCPWTRDYAVVWFSGDDLGVVHVQPLGTNVIPGHALDVTVDMISPQAPGAYQSNWKLRNAQGALFGIGPAGASPFWARIIVVPMDTPTVVPLAPTETPVPVVLASGDVSLTLDSSIDLDTGSAGTAGDKGSEDLALQQQPEGQVVLSPVNGLKLVPFGVVPPDLPACLAVLLSDALPAVEQILPGTYYCYRTGQGLPGSIELKDLNAENQQVDLKFITWTAP